MGSAGSNTAAYRLAGARAAIALGVVIALWVLSRLRLWRLRSESEVLRAMRRGAGFVGVGPLRPLPLAWGHDGASLDFLLAAHAQRGVSSVFAG